MICLSITVILLFNKVLVNRLSYVLPCQAGMASSDPARHTVLKRLIFPTAFNMMMLGSEGAFDPSLFKSASGRLAPGLAAA